jgi:hypothetical protein
MALTPLTALERETTIIMNDEDTFITIYSCQRPIITKLDKLCKSNPDTYRLVKSDEYSKTYECPKKLISFRTPSAKRILSEEQKEELRIRMQNARKKS